MLLAPGTLLRKRFELATPSTHQCSVPCTNCFFQLVRKPWFCSISANTIVANFYPSVNATVANQNFAYLRAAFSDSVCAQLREALAENPESFELRYLHELLHVVAPLLLLYYKVLHRSSSFPLLVQYQTELTVLFHYCGNTNYYPAVGLWLSSISRLRKSSSPLYQHFCKYPSLLNEEVGELANNLLFQNVSTHCSLKTKRSYLKRVFSTLHFVDQADQAFFGKPDYKPSPLESLVPSEKVPSLQAWLASLVWSLRLQAQTNVSCSPSSLSRSPSDVFDDDTACLYFAEDSRLPDSLLAQLNKKEAVEGAVKAAARRYRRNTHYGSAELRTTFQELFPDFPLSCPKPSVTDLSLDQADLDALQEQREQFVLQDTRIFCTESGSSQLDEDLPCLSPEPESLSPPCPTLSVPPPNRRKRRRRGSVSPVYRASSSSSSSSSSSHRSLSTPASLGPP